VSRQLGAVLIAIFLIGVRAATQSVSAPGLKAAYLFNFTKFVEWPTDVVPEGTPLALCIVSDEAVADALEQTIKGQTVQGRGLVVRRLGADAPLPTCHVLYLAGSDQKRWLDSTRMLDGRLVLTVSDAARFAQTGGMVELSLERGRMQIAVNTDALQRAKVRLSSRVLALATIVRDVPPP
jgi:hypothetical protein